MNYALAIQHLYPDAEWSMVGNDLATLEWRSEGDPPTQQELDDCWPIVRDAHFLLTMRRQRDRLLTASDWTQLSDNGLSDEQRAAWAEYRQALRDAPANWEPAATWDAPEPPN